MLLVIKNAHKAAVLLDGFPHHITSQYAYYVASQEAYANAKWFGQSRGVLMLRYCLDARIEHLARIAD